MGPSMDNVPTQNKRIPVDSPWARLFPPENLLVSRLKWPSISRISPIRLPMARLAIKSTG